MNSLKQITYLLFICSLLFSCSGESEKTKKPLKEEIALKVSFPEALSEVPPLKNEKYQLIPIGFSAKTISPNRIVAISPKAIGKNIATLFSKEATVQLLNNNDEINALKQQSNNIHLSNGNNILLTFQLDKEGIIIKDPTYLNLYNINTSKKHQFSISNAQLFYAGKKTQPIIDFVLCNTTLSPDGNQIKITINNEATFHSHHWTAYKIIGLHKGRNSIRIELTDKNGQLLEGPFNDSGERIIDIS